MSRDPHAVPHTLVATTGDDVTLLANALASAVRVAIDTETPIAGPSRGQMRVMSVAARDRAGVEQAFVVDARDVDVTQLQPILAGVTADAWNANFDARVVDAAVWRSERTTPALSWWDAQLADALIHQGRSGFGWFHGLAWATEHYLGFAAEGKGTVQLSYTASDDLSVDQVRYAAADAVETLWVGDCIRSELETAGLTRIAEIEMRARPFLDQMERSGLPFDWPGWEAELRQFEADQRQVVGRLAELTGGGQGTLFDEVVEPSWNPASDQQVRRTLNRWSEAEVLAYTEHREGTARHLTDLDSVHRGVLREIGGPLCDALLEFRNVAKILTTYGDSIREYVHDDGRLRPQYLQVVGTNTGRLASRHPNAQNLTPRMKPYFRHPDPDRVFVHADLSQAELRFLAQVSNDEGLRAAFARGEDVHETTAATMFRVDLAELRDRDPSRLKRLRQIAKALNFGIAYGQGAAALARSLSANGTPTTTEEGVELLAQYRQTYPGSAAWAEGRDREIAARRDDVDQIDWQLSMRLARQYAPIASVRRTFRDQNPRWPSAAEIAELLTPGSVPTDEAVAEVAWVLRYSAPVALLADGEPYMFASRTLAGRRQQFNLHLDPLFLRAVTAAVTAPSPGALEVRKRFGAEHGLVLHRRGRSVSDEEVARAFEERALRRTYLDALAARIGDDAVAGYLRNAARERISVMVNAWRNAPIQGGVADIMLVAYSELHERLAAFPDAIPVQTVHDSVVIECDRANARGVAAEVRAALESASALFCPDVMPRADVDIRTSLADADVIETLPAGPA